MKMPDIPGGCVFPGPFYLGMSNENAGHWGTADSLLPGFLEMEQ